MSYVEITWAYQNEINAPFYGTTGDGHPRFYPAFLIAGEVEHEGYTAQELYAHGYRLVAVLPRWAGRVYGTSIWEAPTGDAGNG